MNSKELVERLEKFPKLKERMEELLLIAENNDDEIELADDAEERIIQAGRAMNRDALQAWAEQQASKKASQFEQRHPNTNKDVKKNFVGIADWEK